MYPSYLFHDSIIEHAVDFPSCARGTDIAPKAFSIVSKIVSSLLVERVGRVGLEEQKL